MHLNVTPSAPLREDHQLLHSTATKAHPSGNTSSLNCPFTAISQTKEADTSEGANQRRITMFLLDSFISCSEQDTRHWTSPPHSKNNIHLSLMPGY